ncbi:MAG: murI [Firmicutes bacterium]|nr:murI [Bacillota bacterium]
MKSAAIGVFDSGIGGLTVVKELAALMPHEKIIYFGDTARAPYGSRPPAQIIDFMNQFLRFFAKQEVKMAVVACNTMTALGLEAARSMYSYPLVGMTTGVRTALEATKTKNIGVIATQAAVASGKHGKMLKELDDAARFYPQACPDFVPLIEQGILSGSVLEAAAKEYLIPLVKAKVDALILGCTHYPLISPLIQQIMGKTVTLVNPAGETARAAYRELNKRDLLASTGEGSIKIGFSGDSVMARDLSQNIIRGCKSEFIKAELEEYAII